MFFKFRHVLLIIRGSGTDSSHPKCLAVSNAGFAVRGMTTTLVKVLVGVCWLGIEICHQAVPVTYDFCVEERYRLPRPLSGELDCWME